MPPDLLREYQLHESDLYNSRRDLRKKTSKKKQNIYFINKCTFPACSYFFQLLRDFLRYLDHQIVWKQNIR